MEPPVIISSQGNPQARSEDGRSRDRTVAEVHARSKKFSNIMAAWTAPPRSCERWSCSTKHASARWSVGPRTSGTTRPGYPAKNTGLREGSPLLRSGPVRTARRSDRARPPTHYFGFEQLTASMRLAAYQQGGKGDQQPDAHERHAGTPAAYPRERGPGEASEEKQ